MSVSNAANSLSDQQTRELAELGPSSTDDLDALCRLSILARAALPGALAVSITMRSGGEDFTFASSDPLAEDLDQQQYHQRSGPCIDALELGQEVISEDLATEPRWEDWTRAALAAGVHGMRCLPLIAGGECLGALNIYSDMTGLTHDARVVRTCTLFAEHAAATLVSLTEVRNGRVLVAQLREAMESRAVIEQAKGILMLQLSVDADTAWKYLVRLSQQSHRKIRDLTQLITHRATAGLPSQLIDPTSLEASS